MRRFPLVLTLPLAAMAMLPLLPWLTPRSRPHLRRSGLRTKAPHRSRSRLRLRRRLCGAKRPQR